jgi:hypothetical protein
LAASFYGYKSSTWQSGVLINTGFKPVPRACPRRTAQLGGALYGYK